jgi:hypothetical protein
MEPQVVNGPRKMYSHMCQFLLKNKHLYCIDGEVRGVYLEA